MPCNKALSQIGKPGHNAGLTPAGKRAGCSCCGAADEFATATITKTKIYGRNRNEQTNVKLSTETRPLLVAHPTTK